MKRSDHQRWQSLKNRHQGERLFILGTGPSLGCVPRSALAQEYTFGVNWLCLYGELGFQPTYYGLSEIMAADDLLPAINRLCPRSEKFMAHTYDYTTHLIYGRQLEDWLWVYLNNGLLIEEGFLGGLEDDLDWVAHAPSTTLTCALQVGLWMGFADFYLVGCDNNTGSAHHVYTEEQVQGYYPPSDAVEVEKNEDSRREAVRRACEAAAQTMEAHGRRLWDASAGNLGIPTVDLAEVLGVLAA